jgi:hypothetical protein
MIEPRRLLMLDPSLVMSTFIPAVNPLDIQRLWSLQSEHSAGSAVGYSVEAILQNCESESADPIAVWARTSLIFFLLQMGVLENWRTNDGPSKAVFEAAAVFPLPNGLQGLNPTDFIATLPF